MSLSPLPRVIFVCIENSNRSQMAEGFARRFAGDRVFAASAGSRPSGVVNPRAVQMMAELGIDIAGHHSNGLDDLPAEGWDVVITMGCGDECPWLPSNIREDWALTDPKHLDDDGFRAVRDEIADRVRDLLERLGVSST